MLGLVPVWRTEAHLGVEVAASMINAGFVEYMRPADEMLQPFLVLVKGRGGRLSCDLFEGMRQAG